MNHRESVRNWVTSLDMVCAHDYEIGMFGAVFFLGYMFGCATIMRLADIWGRKPVLILSTSVVAATAFMQIVINNQIAVYLLLFCNGFFFAPRQFCSYMLALEYAPEKYEQMYALVAQLVDAVSVIFIGIYFYS